MSETSKDFLLSFVVILAVSSLIMVESASAQTTPRPSVPEFTVKVVDTNLEVTIKNQPLTPFENGSSPGLYYMFRFGDNNTRIGAWDYDPIYYVLPSTFGGYYEASDSDFTTVSLSLKGHQFPSGQIGIQAVALIGKQYPTNEQNGTVYAFEQWNHSGWSNTQTITIPKNNTSPTPTSTPPIDRNPPHLEPIEYVLPISVIVAVVIVLSALLYRRHRKSASLSN